MQLYRNMLKINWWALLIVERIVGLAVEPPPVTSSFMQNLGPMNLHANTGSLPPKSYPLRWDERYATHKAIDFIRYIKTQPEFNPLRISGSMGPYRIHFDDVKLYANMTLDKIVVHGLKEIQFPFIEVRVAPHRIDTNLTAPLLTVEANFSLNGSLNDELMDVFGYIKTGYVDLNIAAALGPTTHADVCTLDSVDVYISLRDIQLKMDLNEYADIVKPILFNFFQNTRHLVVGTDVVGVLFKTINQKLAKFPIKQILMMIFAMDPGPGRRYRKDGKKRPNFRRKYS